MNKPNYYSQLGQDKLILEYFHYKKEGFFVEIGAFDGVSLSNTKAMEDLGWMGICIEPNPDAFDKLCKNRRSYNFNVALSDKS